jgi:hypothetical protein
VDARVEKKLRHLPFKWKNYFAVSSGELSVGRDASKKLSLSKDCEIEVKNLGDDLVEVSLFGKGKLVSKIRQSLPAKELLVTGGNAENFTAWFVVLQQAE